MQTLPAIVCAEESVTSLSIFSSPQRLAPAFTVRPGTVVAAPVYHSVPGPTTHSNTESTNERSEIVVVPLPETRRPPKPASVSPSATVPPPVTVGFVFSVWSPVTDTVTFVASPSAAATVSAFLSVDRTPKTMPAPVKARKRPLQARRKTNEGGLTGGS